MNYLKILKAQRQSGRQPTMRPVRLTREQVSLADAGRCIECGLANSATHSYLCEECQGRDTMEDIRGEIAAVRRSLLMKP